MVTDTNIRSTLRIRHIVAAAVIIGVLVGTHLLLVRLESGSDRSDYKKVATEFISSHPIIAQKMGKVTNLSHAGVGGAAGPLSHNVYKVTGEERSGVMHITLERDTDGQWSVRQAMLTMDGRVFGIPVRRTDGGKPVNLFSK